MQEKELQPISASEFYKMVDSSAIEDTYQYVVSNNIELKPSKKYDVIINNKPFPPKDFLRVMAQLKGYKINEINFMGGQANKPFEKIGFTVDNKSTVTQKINTHLLGNYWVKYKEYFKQPESKHKEKYKWKVLKQVFDRWNWDAENKTEMFKNAFEVKGSKNLWMSGNFYPIPHTNWMFEEFRQETLEVFENLFNEEVQLTDRVKKFIQLYDDKIPELQNKLPNKKIQYHSHGDSRAISLYLYLQNPNKYFLFKYTMVKNFCEQVGIPKIKAGDKTNVKRFNEIANEVLEFIKQDTSFIKEYRLFTTKNEHYNDESLHLLVQDFVYSVANHFKENIKCWRIGTSDGNKSYWEEMQSENKVCIGWKELENLDLIKPKNKKDIIKKLTNTGYYLNDERTKSRKAGEIFDFYKKVNTGDIVLAQTGFDILGIGRVVEDYEFSEDNEFPHQKEVEWLVINPDIQNEQGNRTTVYEITKRNIIDSIKNILEDKSNNTMEVKDLFDLYKQYLEGENGKHLSPKSHIIYHEDLVEKFPLIWEMEYINSKFSRKDLSKSNLLRIKKLSTPPYSYDIKGISYFFSFIQELYKELFPFTLNQILYGPPGTGKTYKTKALAVEIIDGFVPKKREELTKRYLELIESGQIHFTTFHQSMSYEDFIEGIKPKMTDDNNGEIEYEIKSGLFKQICELATFKEVSNFNDAYDEMIKNLSESEDEYLVLETPRGKEFRVNVNSKDNLTLYTTSKINKQGVLSKSNLEAHYQGEDIFKGWEGYALGVLEYLEEQYNLSKEEKQPNQKYVLIIDEINRGNVSAIFGELITLIEDDKRAGKDEAIPVTLPYSKKPFSVPKNIHIIGTMNTADRSVEALDTALRRRFSFTEMLPKPELLSEIDYKEIDIEKLLFTINERIELLIDKDHQIGHSYFFKVKTFEDLKVVFKDKIIPLLEEYFYGDFGKIGLVLGGHFVKPKESKNKNVLAQNFKFETEFIEEKELYEFINADDWTIETFTSIYLNTPLENE